MGTLAADACAPAAAAILPPPTRPGYARGNCAITAPRLCTGRCRGSITVAARRLLARVTHALPHTFSSGMPNPSLPHYSDKQALWFDRYSTLPWRPGGSLLANKGWMKNLASRSVTNVGFNSASGTRELSTLRAANDDLRTRFARAGYALPRPRRLGDAWATVRRGRFPACVANGGDMCPGRFFSAAPPYYQHSALPSPTYLPWYEMDRQLRVH